MAEGTALLCGGGTEYGGAAAAAGSYVKNILSTSTGISSPFCGLIYFADTSADATGVQFWPARA